MNKYELIAHFQEQKKIIEKEIAFWQAAEVDTEAEKPKRKHGDFGLSKKPERWPRLTLETLGGKLFTAGKQACEEIEDEKQDYPDPVFGNIFKMMTDWGKPFEKFEKKITCDRRTFIIEKSGWSLKDLYIGIKDDFDSESRKGVQLTQEEAYEFWCELGHALMEVKRKQSSIKS